jgi:hypothetical protein
MKKNVPPRDFKSLRQIKARQQFGFEGEKTTKKASHADKKGEIPDFPFNMERGLKNDKRHEAPH